MIPAPTKSALARIIAWRDSLYKAWAAKNAPAKPAKNPRRVEGGKKAAETRRRNKEIALHGTQALTPVAFIENAERELGKRLTADECVELYAMWRKGTPLAEAIAEIQERAAYAKDGRQLVTDDRLYC